MLYNCGAIYEGTASASGTTGTIVDNKLSVGAADDYRGTYIWFTSGTNNANQIRRVTASSISSGVTTLTFLPVVTDATANGDTYQLIGKKSLDLHPERVNAFINQAILEATGRAFDPEESVALHGDGEQKRFDIPSEFKMLSNVYTRQSVDSLLIHDATTEWDEQTVTNVTRAVDTKDSKWGSASNRFTIASAFTTGVVASKAITSLDLRGMTHVEFWIKSSTTTVSGDFTLLLDDTALAGSALETLTVPALTAREWQYVRVALSNPELDSAIISVALNAANNIAANVVWISDVKAVNQDSAVWIPMSTANWRVDEEARDIVFTFAPPYRLIKLEGGDNPLLFSADSDANEIDDQFVIARATELTMLSLGSGADADQLRKMAAYWGARANEAYRSLPMLYGVKAVS